jgi:hypothetical protein
MEMAYPPGAKFVRIDTLVPSISVQIGRGIDVRIPLRYGFFWYSQGSCIRRLREGTPTVLGENYRTVPKKTKQTTNSGACRVYETPKVSSHLDLINDKDHIYISYMDSC